MLHTIFWELRVPKAITCVLAGSALATGGLLMQTLFRNPLAGPDVFGLTSGAGLMVALLLLGNFVPVAFQAWGGALAATVGSALVFIVILRIANYVTDTASLLIAGLMISAMASSTISVLQYVSESNSLKLFTIWSLGNVGNSSKEEIFIMTLVILPLLFISYRHIKALNTLHLGENFSGSLGIDVRRTKYVIIALTCVLTGVVTAFCGPVAFVGIAVPHLVKSGVRSANHKILLPQVMMIGGALLLFCDIVAQTVGRVQALPLNAVTCMVGAPVVIAMVMKLKKSV